MTEFDRYIAFLKEKGGRPVCTMSRNGERLAIVDVRGATIVVEGDPHAASGFTAKLVLGFGDDPEELYRRTGAFVEALP